MLILIGWVIFNCTSLSSLTVYLHDLIRFGAVSAADWGYCLYLLRQHWAELLFGLVFCLPLVPRIQERFSGKSWYTPVTCVLLLALLWLCLVRLAGSSFNPFIYFRF